VGQNRDETRLVIVDFPQDFMVKELAGKKADYTVTLREIKEKKLPELNDAFAAKLAEGKSLAELRQMIEHDLAHEKQHELERAKETQILKYLHEQTQLEPPPLLLQNETRRALADLVQRNRDRGVPDDALKEKEKELVEAAAGMAAYRLKTNFILERVAERERIEVSPQELDARIRQEAARYEMPVEKMRKQLEEHNGLSALTEQILLGKTLAFLKANVSVKKRAVGQET
jgi:trigger factor